MKVSVSLSEEDLSILDRYVEQAGLRSRSAGVQHAIRRLRDRELESAYASAWQEWAASGDEEAWASTSADGLS